MDDAINYVLALPLLERSYHSVAADPQSAIAELKLGIDPLFLDLRALTIEGLSISPYWADLAMSWLEAGLPMDATIANALERWQLKESGAQQSSRQLAFKLLARWSRQSTNP